MRAWDKRMRMLGVAVGVMGMLISASGCSSGVVKAPGEAAGEGGGGAQVEGPEDVQEEAFPADLEMPDDPAPFIGAYGMSGETEEGPVERTLELNGNMEVLMSVRWPERSPVPVVETGIWQVSGAPDRPTAIVELNTRDGMPMDSADVITFELVGDGELVAIIYNLDLYGAEGLYFVRSD